MLSNLKLYIYATVFAALVAGATFMRHHWIQEGLARQRAADTAELTQAREAASRKEKEWEKKYVDAQLVYETEHAANAAQPHIQPVWVCRQPPSYATLPTASGAANGPSAVIGSLPSGGGLPVEGFDLGPSIELLARSADAVVAECRRLNNDVLSTEAAEPR